MTEGSDNSMTFEAGSEEDIDVICDPCLNEGERVQATGHCLDCCENLCGSCFKLHKKLSALKNHDLRGSSTLLLSKKIRASSNTLAEEQDPLTDRCREHPEELIRFYCNSHHTLCCSVCVSLNHVSCKADVLYIRDVSERFTNSDELKKIQVSLQLLVARCSSTLSRAKWTKQSVNDSYAQTVSDISNFKREIIEILDELEKEILEKSSIKLDEINEAMAGTVSACENMIGEVEGIIANIEQKQSMYHKNSLFISMKKAQDRIRTLAYKASHADKNSNAERFIFKPNEHVTGLRSCLTALGTLSLVDQRGKTKVDYLHDITIKSDTDAEECSITGLAVLPKGRLALADLNNMSIKLVDITERKLTGQINLESNPIDLTFMKEKEIAVTVRNKRYIQVISISPTLSKRNTIAMPGLYNGIEYLSNKLILVCAEPVQGVHIFDMSGRLLQQIETDYNGKNLFTLPVRITISPDHGVLYITDNDENTVVSMTMGGALLSKSENNRFRHPRGIAVDDGGCVVVCSNKDNVVYKLSHNGKFLQTLLEKKDGIKAPYAIVHSAGHLYIGSNSPEPAHCNIIRVYSFK